MKRAAVPVLVFATLALLDGVVTAVVVAVAVWAVVDWVARRPRHPRPVVVRPAWGYEFPWADLPGLAYVGESDRAPYQLDDGTWWLPRWDDDGHHAQRADVDMGRAVIYEFTSSAEAEAWERARVAELAAAGHRLLNIEFNPSPCWERLAA